MSGKLETTTPKSVVDVDDLQDSSDEQDKDESIHKDTSVKDLPKLKTTRSKVSHSVDSLINKPKLPGAKGAETILPVSSSTPTTVGTSESPIKSISIGPTLSIQRWESSRKEAPEPKSDRPSQQKYIRLNQNLFQDAKHADLSMPVSVQGDLSSRGDYSQNRTKPTAVMENVTGFVEGSNHRLRTSESEPEEPGRLQPIPVEILTFLAFSLNKYEGMTLRTILEQIAHLSSPPSPPQLKSVAVLLKLENHMFQMRGDKFYPLPRIKTFGNTLLMRWIIENLDRVRTWLDPVTLKQIIPGSDNGQEALSQTFWEQTILLNKVRIVIII